jgi:quinoprotein glucose dehydrogenase
MGGTAENNHYSGLAQINRSNVKHLAVAWSFDSQEEGGLQTSPIVAEGVLYGITPTQRIVALDATTGKLFWKFYSGVRGHNRIADSLTRLLAYSLIGPMARTRESWSG